MSLYDGAKTRVRIGIQATEEFEDKVVKHQGSVFSPFLCDVVVDIVTEMAREKSR